MRALSFKAVGEPLQLVTLPLPEPGPGEVILKVSHCGICGTDIHRTEENIWTFKPDTVPGHEFAGEVMALGLGVDSLKVGQRVTALPYIGCNACARCLAGEPYFCTQSRNIGTEQIQGAYAEYVRASAVNCVPLPVDLSLEDGALVEPLAVGLHAVKRGRIGPADRVLVTGAGPIGLAVIWWARRVGARKVVVAATSDRRREMAMAMGADEFIVCREGGELAAMAKEALSGLPDVVVECVGLPGTIATAISCVASQGRVVVAGACSTADSFYPLLGLAREADILFSTVYDRDEFHQCVDAMDRGDVAPRAMITDKVSLEDAPQAFEGLRGRSHHCKILVTPNG